MGIKSVHVLSEEMLERELEGCIEERVIDFAGCIVEHKATVRETGNPQRK